MVEGNGAPLGASVSSGCTAQQNTPHLYSQVERMTGILNRLQNMHGRLGELRMRIFGPVPEKASTDAPSPIEGTIYAIAAIFQDIECELDEMNEHLAALELL